MKIILGRKLTLLSTLIFASTGQIHAQMFSDMPDAIVCSVNQTIVKDQWQAFVFYASGKRKEDSRPYLGRIIEPC